MIINRLVGKKLSYNGFAHRDNRETGLGLSDKCTLFRTQVELVEINTALGIKALAIELVGDRFLRRMVRILVVSQRMGFNLIIIYCLHLGNCS